MANFALRQAYDEQYYLQAYPDVAASVAAGTYAAGWDHYLAYGKAEGRRAMPPATAGADPVASVFDEAWYLETTRTSPRPWHPACLRPVTSTGSRAAGPRGASRRRVTTRASRSTPSGM